MFEHDVIEPCCSIVVPTHRRPLQLADCLAALAELDYPHSRFEVIVVDDGGRIPLGDVVDAFRSKIDLTVLSQERAGPAAARNTGAAYARGELLAFTDDDCRPSPDWLRRLAERYISDPWRILGGRTINALANNRYAATSQLIIDIGYIQNNVDPEDAKFFTSNNLALPAKGLRAVGGFDPNFTTSEDRDLCARWIARGFRMTYVPEAIVYHGRELTLRSFLGQQFAYGRGAFLYHREQARRWNRRTRLEPSYYFRLAKEPFRKPRREGMALACLLLVWHVANTAGFIWEWWNQRSRGRRRSRSGPMGEAEPIE